MPVERKPHSRRWQFSLFTLLVAMTCVGLACVALISPGELWKGLVFVLAAGSLLVAGLCIVYRDGRSRAFAVGFVIFGLAYFFLSLGDTPDAPDMNPNLPTTRWGIALYTLMHGESVRTTTVVGAYLPAPWPVRPVPVTTLPAPPVMTTRVVTATADADPSDVSVVVTEVPVSQPVYLPPPLPYPNPITTQYAYPRVPLSSFLAVVHHLLVLTLGVLGGIVAQILYSTRREAPPVA
jgi:hypothetical protein